MNSNYTGEEIESKLDRIPLDDSIFISQKNKNKILIYKSEENLYSKINPSNFSDNAPQIEQTYYNSNTRYGCVLFSEDITKVGQEAFRENEKLLEIYLPTSVKIIGNAAFGGCTNLSYIEGLDNVTELGDSAFAVTKLSYINIPSIEIIGKSAFYEVPIKNINLPNTLREIKYQAFIKSGLESIELPSSLQKIGYYVFRENISLKQVKINSNATTDYDASSGGLDEKYVGPFTNCFYNCTSLEEVYFNTSLETIGGQAFFGCTKLKYIKFPNNLKTLKLFAFYGCASLTNIDLPESLEVLEKQVFMLCNLDMVTIPKNVSIIGTACFWRRDARTDQRYKEEACSAKFLGKTPPILQSNEANQNITGESEYPFGYKDLVTIYVDSSNIKNYKDREDYSSYNIQPENSNKSTWESIYNQYQESDIFILEYHSTSGEKASLGINNPILHLWDPSSNYGSIIYTITSENVDENGYYEVRSIFKTNTQIEDVCIKKCAFKCRLTPSTFAVINQTLKTFTLEGNCDLKLQGTFTSYPMLEEVKILDAKVELDETFHNNGSIKKICIPNTTIIEKRTFADTTSLYEVDLGNNITSIGQAAFTGSAIRTLIIPDSVTELGSNVCENCTNLKRLILSKSITTIPDYAFRGCENLGNVEIPSNIRGIGREAFYDCDLKNVKLPTLDTVQGPSQHLTLGPKAFGNNPIENFEIENFDILITEGKIFSEHKPKNIVIKYCEQFRLDQSFNFDTFNVYINDETVGPENIIFYSKKVPTFNNERPSPFSLASNIVLKEGLIEIGQYAFKDSIITSINFPDSLTTIGYQAFSGVKLKDIKFGPNIKSIGRRAFYTEGYVQNSRTITFEGIDPPTLDSEFINTSSVNAVYVPKKSYVVYKTAFDGGGLPLSNLSAVLVNYEFPQIKGIKSGDTNEDIIINSEDTVINLATINNESIIGEKSFNIATLSSGEITQNILQNANITLAKINGESILQNKDFLLSVNKEGLLIEKFGYSTNNTVYTAKIDNRLAFCSSYVKSGKSVTLNLDIPKITEEDVGKECVVVISVEKNSIINIESDPYHIMWKYDNTFFGNCETSGIIIFKFTYMKYYNSNNAGGNNVIVGEYEIHEQPEFTGFNIYYKSTDGEKINVKENEIVSNSGEPIRCVEHTINSITKKGVLKYDIEPTRIEPGAFYDISNLEQISLPNTITSFGDGIFSGCENLITIKNKYTINNGTILAPNGEIKAYAQGNQTSILVIDEGPVSINALSFANSNSINPRMIVVPDSVESIEQNAFMNTNIQSIVLGINSNVRPDYLVNLPSTFTGVVEHSCIPGAFFNNKNVDILTYTVPSVAKELYDSVLEYYDIHTIKLVTSNSPYGTKQFSWGLRKNEIRFGFASLVTFEELNMPPIVDLYSDTSVTLERPLVCDLLGVYSIDKNIYTSVFTEDYELYDLKIPAGWFSISNEPNLSYVKEIHIPKGMYVCKRFITFDNLYNQERKELHVYFYDPSPKIIDPSNPYGSTPNWNLINTFVNMGSLKVVVHVPCGCYTDYESIRNNSSMISLYDDIYEDKWLIPKE